MAGIWSSQDSANLIVGRQREREQLRRVLARALDGESGLTLISGEAGIGKSTLVDDLRDAAEDEGCLVLTGGCYDLETTPPYGPWAEIIRTYPDAPDLPTLPDELRVGGGMAGIDSQAALFDLVDRFFQEVVLVRPLTLILEDIHWADSASLDLLRYLARTASGVPLFLVATYRDDEITGDHPLFMLLPALVRESRAIRIELRRLDVTNVADLVRARYELTPDDQERLVTYLDRLAEGSPFFITELLHALEEQATLQPLEAGWLLGDLNETGVPSLVQQVIARRMMTLEGSTRILLDIAAVAGRDASLDLLSDVYGGAASALDDNFQQALDHQLLVLQPDGRGVRFSHALVRQTVYESIPPLRRRSLHRQTGDRIAGRARPDPDRAAHHFYRADDERGLEWLVKSAEQAHLLFAPGAVVVRCEQAVELAEQLEIVPPLGVYRLRGLALDTLGDFDGARASHEMALERARAGNDLQAEWQALLDLAALWSSRDYDRTGDYCKLAVDLARRMDDPAVLAHSLNRLGNWQLNMGDPSGGVPLYEESLALFKSIGDLEAVATTLDLLAMGHQFAGDAATSLKYFAQVIPLLRDIDDRWTLSSALANAAGISAGYGIVRGATFYELPPNLGPEPADLIQESADIARSIGWKAGECYAIGVMGLPAILRGNLRAGLTNISNAKRLAEEIEHLEWQVVFQSHLALSYLYVSAPRYARDTAHRTSEVASRLSSSVHGMMLNGVLASACVGVGDFEEAHRLLSDLAPLSTDDPVTILLRTEWFAAVELALAENRLDSAAEHVEKLLASFPDDGGIISPEAVRLKGVVLLACGRLDEAETSLVEARRTAEVLNLNVLIWRIHANLRKLYLAQGRLVEADEAGDEALAIINDLADQLDDAPLRSEFLANARSEIPPSPPYGLARNSRVAYAGLTPREIEVLQLVAQGLTNEEASEQLFISPRTVDQHLRSIYNKLDVTNRTAASRIAIDRGIL